MAVIYAADISQYVGALGTTSKYDGNSLSFLRPFPGVCIGRGGRLIYAVLMDTADSINRGQSMPTSSFI